MDIEKVLTVLGAAIGVVSLIGLILYLIASIARYRYLKIRSYENAWLAFIPIANIWAVVEATYGNREKINIYGWEAPAIVLKLWPIVTYVLALVINVIPLIGSVLSILLYILDIAVLAMIFKDIMEQLDKPQETVTAVIVVIFRVIADILILSAASRFQNGEQDYRTDNRILGSQANIGGPLSFLNGKI